MSVDISVLCDGTEVLISDEKFKTMYFTKDGDEKPSKWAIVLTEDMKDAIKQALEA